MIGKYYYGTGRRKSSVARVFIQPGKGAIVVNDKPVEEYFSRHTSQMVLKQPLELTENQTAFDIKVNVTGGGEILREISNANGNPQSALNELITISFPNSDVLATRDGFRVVEWVQGSSSGTWTDNVYEVSGTWNTTFNSGFSRSGTVTEVLVRRLSCLFVESGKIVIEQQGKMAEIDWGNGTCDNEATLTYNGTVYPIILGD